MVGHEEGVEPAALERLRETLEMLEIEVRIRLGATDNAMRAVWMLTGRMKAPRRS